MTNWGDPNHGANATSGADRQWQAPGAPPAAPSTPPPPAYGQYAPQQGPAYAPYPQQHVPLVPRPGVIPLRPLGMSDIFEGAFRTVRGNPAATIGLSLLVTCVAAVPVLLLTAFLGNVSLGSGSGSSVLSLLQRVGSTVVTSLVTSVLTGMLIVAVAEAVLGRRISIGATWARVRPRVWALIGTVLLVSAAMLAILAVFGVVCWALYLAGGTVALIIALVLSVFLALAAVVFVQIRFSLASSAVTLERLGPVAALKRSWALTAGQFWRIFGITILVNLLVGIVVAIITMPVSIMVSLSASSSSGDLGMGALVVMEAASLLATALTVPFTASVTGLLYIDQRIRREALDVRLMAEAAKN